MNWINPQPIIRSELAAGDYTAPTSLAIGDTLAVEVAPTDVAATYVTLSNTGPNNIYLAIGQVATTAAYNVVIPPGFNTWRERIGAQALSAICATGESATLMVATAPEVAKVLS